MGVERSRSFPGGKYHIRLGFVSKVHFTKICPELLPLSQCFVSLPGGKMMPKEAPNGRREVICEDALKWLGFEKMNMLEVGQVLIFAATV